MLFLAWDFRWVMLPWHEFLIAHRSTPGKKLWSASTSSFKADIYLRFFVFSWPNFCTTCSTSAKICNVHVKIGNMSNGPFCAIVLKSSGTLLHPPVKPQWASATYMWHRQHVKYWNEGTQQLHGKTHARLRVLTRCFSLVLVLSENWTYP